MTDIKTVLREVVDSFGGWHSDSAKYPECMGCRTIENAKALLARLEAVDEGDAADAEMLRDHFGDPACHGFTWHPAIEDFQRMLVIADKLDSIPLLRVHLACLEAKNRRLKDQRAELLAQLSIATGRTAPSATGDQQ